MTHADTTTETVAELVAALQKRGVRLHADGDRLRFKAPRGALTPALKERLSARKHEVLAHLRGDASPASAEMAMPAISSHPDDRFEPFPLTDLQQAYWLGHQKLFELGNVSAHAYTEYDLRGLDMERLEKAWNRLIGRHEMLRCVVGEDGRQRILETVPFYAIPIEDLRDLDEAERERKLLAERDQMCKYGPTPDTWPLFEMRGFRIGDDHYRVHWSSSLLVVDDWSFHVLNVEWFQVYHKLEAELPSFDLSFRDYVLALRDFESSPAYARSLDYWRSRIATLPPAPDLPLAKDPAEIETPWFQRRSRRLSGDEWGRFKELAKQAGVTPSAAICAVYSEALAAFSKDRHFTLNMLFFNRLPIHPEIDALVGNTSSTLLFEVDCRGRVPFGERAKQLQEQLWKDLKHNLVSGVRVLRELAQSQHSAVQTVPVVFASNINAGFSDDDITQSGVGSIYNHMQTSHVWLDHQIFELPGRVLHYNWDAVQGLFPEGLVDRMFDAYGRLLDRLSEAEAWTRPIGDLLAEDERRLRSEVNATTWESGVATRCLHELVFDRARRAPDAVAVIAGDASPTYGEVTRHAAAIGEALFERGARVGELIAVVLEPGWRQVVSVLGIQCSGAAYLPIDPGLPAERFRHLMAHGEVRLAVTSEALDAEAAWPDDVERLVIDRVEPVAGDGVPATPARQQATDLAYVIYTSGSTGLPKGVVIDHRGAANTVADINDQFAVGPEDRVFALSALNFDLSVYDVYGTLAAGGALVYPDPGMHREPGHWLDLMREHRVSLWNSVPALFQMLVDHVEGRGERLPESFRVALLSGDWIPVSLPDRARALAAPDARIVSLGGATEASIWSITYPIDAVDPEWPSIPYGKPLRNQTFHVLDDALDPRPTHVPGPLYIGGVGVALGYWNDADKTAASFLEHPRTGERLYRTGDLGRYLPSGDIEFLGREDFQVKVQGYRIELGEIETTLDQHPAVRQSVVAALGEQRGAKRLVGYVVPTDLDAPPDAEVLQEHLRERIPEYMVPGVFVTLGTIPLSANGKVDRQALPTPEAAGVELGGDSVAPRNALEAQLVSIWEALLERDGIGVTDNFFDLGGHSLVAVRLFARVRQELGVDLSLSTLVEGATVAHLAEVIERRRSGEHAGGGSLVTLTPPRDDAGDDSKTPFFCVHPSGGNVLCYVELARRLGTDQPFYGLQAPGLTGGEAPVGDVRALATRYLAEVRDAQPAGPYHLGGWSMGGVVAFEMARQLVDAGETVASLTILDAVAPDGSGAAAKGYDEAGFAAWFARDLGGLAAAGDPPPNAEALAALDADARIATIVAWGHRSGSLAAEVGDEELGRLLDVFQSNFRAMLAYEPAPWDGPLVVVQARDGLAADPEGAEGGDLGWHRLAPALDLHTVDGDHYTIVAPPIVDRIAAILDATLSGDSA